MTESPSASEPGLGGRLPLVREADLTPLQYPVHERLTTRQVPEAEHSGFVARDAHGRFVGPFNAMLRWPGPGAALLDWAAAQASTGALSAPARQVVTLAVGAVWRADYEVEAHVAGAAAAGISAAAIDAVLARQDHPDLSSDARAARMLADALLTEHAVDDVLYAHALAALGEDGTQAVAHLVGQYVAISALLITFAVPATGPRPIDTNTNQVGGPHAVRESLVARSPRR